MASVSLTFRIDEADKKQIEMLAKKDERSISFIVNKAIKQYILDAKSTEDDTTKQ